MKIPDSDLGAFVFNQLISFSFAEDLCPSCIRKSSQSSHSCKNLKNDCWEQSNFSKKKLSFAR